MLGGFSETGHVPRQTSLGRKEVAERRAPELSVGSNICRRVDSGTESIYPSRRARLANNYIQQGSVLRGVVPAGREIKTF